MQQAASLDVVVHRVGALAQPVLARHMQVRVDLQDKPGERTKLAGLTACVGGSMPASKVGWCQVWGDACEVLICLARPLTTTTISESASSIMPPGFSQLAMGDSAAFWAGMHA